MIRKPSITTLKSVGIVAALALLTQVTPAQAGGMAQDLEEKFNRAPQSTVETGVIVQFAPGEVDPAAFAGKFKGRLKNRFGSINGAALSVPLGQLRALRNDPRVAWVSPDRQVQATSLDADVQTLGADQVWNTMWLRGRGVGVAVLDTGLRSNNGEWDRPGTSSSRLRAWRDFVGTSTTPYDDHGHGTHVSGIALGSGSQSRGAINGVANEADLVALKVLDSQGNGTASRVIAAIDWCIQNKATHNIRVMNLSFGYPPRESYRTDPLCAAARRAVNAGIVVVCAAGNLGRSSLGLPRYGGITCPGNEPNVITVGALNTQATASRADDTVASYSSRGPTYLDNVTKPDVVAPGNQILSVRAPGSYLDTAFPLNRYDYEPLSLLSVDYYRLSGTSMAAPQVAGVVALMLQANSGLKPHLVKGILQYTAQQLTLRDALGTPLTASLSRLTQGAGSVNAVGAVEAAQRINTAAPRGARWLTSALPTSTTLAGFQFQWSNQILQGRQVLTGTDVIGVNQVLWGGDPVADLLPEPPPLPSWNEPLGWAQQVLWGGDGTADDEPIWNPISIWTDPLFSGDNGPSGILTALMVNGE